LKEHIANLLRDAAYEVVDFGAFHPSPGDDYPDYVMPLARAAAADKVDRGIALYGSGVGASICANKVAGVRAGLIHNVFSVRQGAEDDDMNVSSLGGQVIGPALAWELIQTFLRSRFSDAIRHQRRVDKVCALEIQPVVE
jgi:ribose 5-phosphate isomerase B